MSLFNPFKWVREKAAEAFVLGMADGVRAVSADQPTGDADIDAKLKALFAATAAKELPAHEETEEVVTDKKRVRKT